MACTPSRPSARDLLTSPGRLVAAVLGVACVGAGLLTGGVEAGLPLLLPVGGALLLTAAAWSSISSVQLNAGVASVVVSGGQGRKQALTAYFEDRREEFEYWSGELCDDAESAGRVLPRAVEEAAYRWAGPLDATLRYYLLCLMIQFARWEERSAVLHGAPARGRPASVRSFWSGLSTYDRAVFLMADREHLPAAVMAAMLDTSESQVRADLARVRDQADEVVATQ